MNIEITGFLGLVIFILDIVAIVKTIKSGAETPVMVLWIAVILLLPVLGLLLWFFLGPKD